MRWKRNEIIYSDDCLISATKGVLACKNCTEEDCDDCEFDWDCGEGWCDEHERNKPCYDCVVPVDVIEIHSTCGDCPYYKNDLCTRHDIEVGSDDEACDDCPVGGETNGKAP